MSTDTLTKTEHRCKYCEKTFSRESTLAVHVCEQKRRAQIEKEVGVQLGFQAYLRFFEVTQGSSKLKTYTDFARSPYYQAFVKFGRYCVDIRAINVGRFIEYVIQQNKKLDHWAKDSVYTEYLSQHLKEEAMVDALGRGIEESIAWEEETENPAHDYLRYGNANRICYSITTGRISPWVLYNCASGQEFLSNLNPEQMQMIWDWINPDFWQKKFATYPADQEYVKAILLQAGW